VLGAAWVAHQRRLGGRGGAPLVDLSLLRLRTFRAGLALATAFFAAVPPFFLILGLYLQDGRGLTAMRSALAFTPLAVAFVAASLIAPRLFARAGDRLLVAGTALAAAGAAGMIATVSTTSAVAALLPGMVVLGAGAGIVMPGIIHATLRGVPPDSAGSASGVLATAQQAGAALGVAGAGTLYFAALPGDFAAAFQIATAWTLAGAGIGALLALPLAAPAGRLRAATSAAS
jgi:MFS family permease